MLRSTTIFALALCFSVPAVAETAPVTSTRDGQTFEYVTRPGTAGAVQIDGMFLKSREAFTFTVKPNGRVKGFVGGAPVSFRVSPKQYGTMAKRLDKSDPQLAESGAAFSAGTN